MVPQLAWDPVLHGEALRPEGVRDGCACGAGGAKPGCAGSESSKLSMASKSDVCASVFATSPEPGGDKAGSQASSHGCGPSPLGEGWADRIQHAWWASICGALRSSPVRWGCWGHYLGYPPHALVKEIEQKLIKTWT